MAIKSENIGIGLITCDRPDFFKISSKSIEEIDFVKIVVDDGEHKVSTSLKKEDTKQPKSGVAVAKNIALKYLINQKCEHIFLMEDDIEIINPEVFQIYIKASKTTGIKHFNYALHGNHNLDRFGNPVVRKTIKYPNSMISIDLYSNVLGAFSYYHIDTLNEVGLMDENFYNALEHVDHTYQIIKKGYHPPFRWFADVNGSNIYLKDIVPDHQQSKIRNNENFQTIFKNGLDNFIKKNNFSVVNGYGPSENFYSEKETLEILRNIWKKHHQE